MFKNVIIAALSFLLLLTIAIIYVSQPRPIPTGLNAILNINPTKAKPLLKYLSSNEKIQFKILKDECIIDNKTSLPPVKYKPYISKAWYNTKINCKEVLKLSK